MAGGTVGILLMFTRFGWYGNGVVAIVNFASILYCQSCKNSILRTRAKIALYEKQIEEAEQRMKDREKK